jgi:quercetin dioxygenase-like cupin family protein
MVTIQDGFALRRVFDRETHYLRKLQCHLTTLQPGVGYAPHVDAHDVAILVRTGTVETLGAQVGPGGVIFYAAGERHGLKNVGDTDATYLVFEFHGGDAAALDHVSLRIRWQRWHHAIRKVKRRIPLLRRIALRRQGE